MPSISYKKSSQLAIRDWLSATAWSNPFCVTLNLKQAVGIEADNGRSFVRLTEQHASQNLRHFLNRLGKRYLGNAARRYGKKLPIIPVLEGGTGHRLHYHLIIDLPATATLDDVYPLFVTEWMKTQWGYGQVHIQPCRDDGWLNYITKLRSKIDVGESIDWMNLYHPSLTAH
jgi:hypothetical protein